MISLPLKIAILLTENAFLPLTASLLFSPGCKDISFHFSVFKHVIRTSRCHKVYQNKRADCRLMVHDVEIFGKVFPPNFCSITGFRFPSFAIGSVIAEPFREWYRSSAFMLKSRWTPDVSLEKQRSSDCVREKGFVKGQWESSTANKLLSAIKYTSGTPTTQTGERRRWEGMKSIFNFHFH